MFPIKRSDRKIKQENVILQSMMHFYLIFSARDTEINKKQKIPTFKEIRVSLCREHNHI